MENFGLTGRAGKTWSFTRIFAKQFSLLLSSWPHDLLCQTMKHSDTRKENQTVLLES